MRSIESAISVLVAVAFTAGMLPIPVVAQDDRRADTCRDMANRIKEAKDLSAMEALSQEIEQRWRSSDAEVYARCMSTLAGELRSRKLGDTMNKQRGLAQYYAMRTLDKADQIPLDLECELLRGVQQRLDAGGNELDGQPWAQLRREQATLWLHAWRRLQRVIDPNWDPDDLPMINVPAPDGFPAGVAPEAVEDPQARARYKAAIVANREKAAKYDEQYRARQLQQHWLKTAEQFIISSYMVSPGATSELQSLLEQYITDTRVRERILRAVSTKKMPEHLTVSLTTKPSQGE